MSKKLTKEDIIERANEIYNGKYDYSLFLKDDVIYNGTKDIIDIICPVHGVFHKSVDKHLHGQGCQVCSAMEKAENQIKPFAKFVKEANEKHGEKYIYYEETYVKGNVKMNIKCKECGNVFPQTPIHHLRGEGCPFCYAAKEPNNKMSVDEFESKATNIHGGKYKYIGDFIATKESVTIICSKHGKFTQEAENHLQGHGCPYCKESHLEREIRLFLDENKIPYEYQWHLPWAKYYSLDFYLPQLNLGIECQGAQHHEENHFFENLDEVKKRDNFKLASCEENGIKILYYSNIEHEGWINDKEKLLEVIKK